MRKINYVIFIKFLNTGYNEGDYNDKLILVKSSQKILTDS